MFVPSNCEEFESFPLSTLFVLALLGPLQCSLLQDDICFLLLYATSICFTADSKIHVLRRQTSAWHNCHGIVPRSLRPSSQNPSRFSRDERGVKRISSALRIFSVIIKFQHIILTYVRELSSSVENWISRGAATALPWSPVVPVTEVE